jgi:hypothetical protein
VGRDRSGFRHRLCLGLDPRGDCRWLVLIRDNRVGKERNGPEGPSDLFASCEAHFFFAFAGFVLAFFAAAFLAIGYSFVDFEAERSADAATPNQR